MTAAPTIPGWDQATDEQKHWALMLLIDDEDVARANAYWRRHANPIFAGMLDGDGFSFDERRQLYIRDNGRTVTEDETRWLYLSFLTSAADEMEADAAKMIQGKIPLDDWVGMQVRAVKDEYIASSAVGVGGTSRLTSEDLQDVEGKAGESGLADAIERIKRFSGQIKAKSETPISDEQIIYRSGLYAKPGYSIFQESRRNSHIRAVEPEEEEKSNPDEPEKPEQPGEPKKPETDKPLFAYEMNVLGPAEKHCRSSEMKWGWTTGCIECTNAGWVEIGTLPPIGARTCTYGCLCHLVFAIEPPKPE